MHRVLLVDDHVVVRRGVRAILEDHFAGIRVSEAGSGDDALVALADPGGFDALVLDLSMPGRSGMDLVTEIKHRYPKLPVLIMSLHGEEQFAVRALRAGAAGYLTKAAAPEQLVAAINRITKGGKYISETLAEKLALDVGGDQSAARHDRLSDREFDVMRGIASGTTVSEIAVQMHLSVKTVSTYRTRLLEKMGMSSNAELTRLRNRKRSCLTLVGRTPTQRSAESHCVIHGTPTVFSCVMTKTARMKVLIVDGSKQKRHDLVEALAELTNVVVQGAVSHVRTALSAVADASPDVIVTGVVLPDGEGTHLIERVRRMATPPSIVVIADPGSPEQRERYLAAGADRYVAGENVGDIQAAVVGLRDRDAGLSAFQSQRLLGRMTAGVVHDLNNYLAVLDGSLELLHRHPDDMKELWPPIRSMVDSIQDLIGNLLAYARGGNPPMEALDLGEVVREALVIGRRMIPTNVMQTVEIAGGLRSVHGVRAELQQLVLNLLINACDAMPLGGALHIAVKGATPRALMLEISDTGHGKPREPTSGRSASTKPGRNGVGLGLGIVHGVVAHHNGALRILERIGGGTLVAVMLPTQSGN